MPSRRVFRPRRAVALGATLSLVAVMVLGVRSLGSPALVSAGNPLDPAYFAPGACEAFAATRGNRHQSVFLDAGHGGIDPGGVGVTKAGTPVYESNVNLSIELDVMALLRAKGFRVVVSRTTNSTVLRLVPGDTDGGVLSLQGSHDDVAARDVCADLAKADALVGIYMDAGGSPSEGGSVTVYDAARSFASANLRLATLLQSDVLAAMNAKGWQIPNDRVLPDSGFGSFVGNASAGGIAGKAAAYNHLLLIGPAEAGFFATPSTMPGAVIEPLYLTDPFEGSIAADKGDQEVIAGGVAKAVEQFLAPRSGPGAAKP